MNILLAHFTQSDINNENFVASVLMISHYAV